jgi:selenocysteine lyase/cysteine desulfurase
MQQLIRQHQPKLVAATYIPTSSGLVQPVAAIGQFCRAQEVLYLVDACQAAGQLPLDVEAIGCDFLTATFRKFMRGPRGAGFLYVSDRVLESNYEPLFLDLQGANWTSPETYELQATATRFEIWERSYALLLGSATATDYALAIGLEAIAQRVQAIAHYSRQQLSTIPNVQVLDKGAQLCGIVTFHIEGKDPTLLQRQLHERHINVSITGIGSARFDFQRKGVNWALRASPHYYNTEEEIDALVGALEEILK